MAFLILVTFCGVCAVLVYFSRKSGTQGSWIQFFAKGTDSGFSLREIELLRKLAVRCNLQEPSSLFWSQEQLDKCIRALVKSQKTGGEAEDTGGQDFLSKLYEYRKKVEMEKTGVKSGISNSRQISEGQNLRVLVPGTGVFRSQMIRNTSENIIISRPVNDKVGSGFSWTGTKISIYFWRENDAGYVFDTEVLDEVFSKGISSLKIGHVNSLYRTQKRKSIRIKINKPAYLYLLGPDEETGKIETVPGARCILEDLSETGCAVIIGGQAAAGMRIKVQFALDGTPICMSGTVRSVDYKEAFQRSLLHIEADPLPLYAQNKIMGEVFGMQEDDGDELPYRVRDDNSGAASGEIPDTLGEMPKKPPVPVTISAAAAFTAPQKAEAESLPLAAGAEGFPVDPALGDEPPLIPFPPEGGIL
ncbi:MAG: PilZ domain-containing protein [Treponema sp.]|jgi:c-di-GMP-binding flagellar brake protein YcgR|nr:PilZ domain-containing protein [Treponema sp.]